MGHRGIDGVADILIEPLQGAAILRVVRLGERNDFSKNADFLISGWSATKQNIDDLLEIEQPERQLQVPRIDDVGAVTETAAVFVMHIEQQPAELRPRLHDLLKDERHRARFANAGSAKDGKVLAEQFIDV